MKRQLNSGASEIGERCDTKGVVWMLIFVLVSTCIHTIAVAQIRPSNTNANALPDTLAANFEKVVLTRNVTNPMELAIAYDGRVFFTERAGAIKVWEPETGQARMAGYIPVNIVIEDGMHGITLDPNFERNNWLYLYYTPAEGGPNRLSRFTYVDGWVSRETEQLLLTVEVQREVCCHSGGSLTFDAKGNLFLSTGDNSGGSVGFGPRIDERPGHGFGDAQRTSANTNDLRGKILRIHPNDDGTYSIPEGNLFTPDSLHRGEIYTMGHRNPYRIAVDTANGWVYWGDVGNGNPPDRFGATGWDEFNQARGPGYFGWPHFAGPNDSYRDYNYATEEMGDFFDPMAPLNDSPHNTGAKILPPAQPSFIWYTYGISEEFPELGAGGASPNAGPVYHYNPETVSPNGLPAYYDGKWFISEWMRHWIEVITFDENGDLKKIEPFLPGMTFVRPMDMEIGPDGRLYVIEWGDEFWGSNADAQIVRVDYIGPTGRKMASTSPAQPNADLVIAQPLEGSFFDFDKPLDYRVELKKAGMNAQAVQVQPFTGFDTHTLPLPASSGTSGTFTITQDYKHKPDLYFANRFAVLEAEYAGTRTSIVLQPRRKEAEHVSMSQDAVRNIYGIHPASKGYDETVFTTMTVKSGSYLAYEPINLKGIESMTFRYRPEKAATLEVRVDAPDGTVLARIELANTPGSIKADPYDVIQAIIQDNPRRRRGLRAGVYEGWNEITVPIKDPGGRRTLYLVFKGEESENLLQLDWMYFNGDVK